MILHILVTDSHVLRVFRYESQSGLLEEIVTYYNADARVSGRELSSDRCGRVVNGPAGIHQVYTPRSDAAAYALLSWLRRLARSELLQVCRNRSAGLVLVAQPRLLAQLRESLSKQAYPPILAELPRNLARQSVTDLKQRLQPTLRAAVMAQRFSGVRRRVHRRFKSSSLSL